MISEHKMAVFVATSKRFYEKAAKLVERLKNAGAKV
jgi:hypothetical protein